jgi:predicted DNA-binding ArsR family transcriptional regulator
MVTLGTIVKPIGLAPKEEVDEDMRKMIMIMIQKTNMMMSLAEPYAFLVVFVRATLQRDSSLPTDRIKYELVHEPEAWIDDYLQTIKVQGGTKETAIQSL